LSSSKDKSNLLNSVCAVIPFYNEKNTLGKVIEETSKYVQHIFAVNDGSDDYEYQEERKNPDVSFVELGKNFGKGKALREGFSAAITLDFETVITLDADLQHNPEFIPKLIAGLKDYDIVVGNRLKNLTSMPLQRRMSNKLTSFFLTKKTGKKILDSQCGFRAYSAKVLKEVQTIYNGFEAESEILVKAARKGFKIGFVDVPTIYGIGKSKMRPVQAIFGFIKVILQA
jgi:glycosyltransferase involved in cell wall biosynthesis